jgi:hypothetical protein
MKGSCTRGEVVTPNLVGNHDTASEARHPLIRNDGTQGLICTHAHGYSWLQTMGLLPRAVKEGARDSSTESQQQDAHGKGEAGTTAIWQYSK